MKKDGNSDVKMKQTKKLAKLVEILNINLRCNSLGIKTYIKQLMRSKLSIVEYRWMVETGDIGISNFFH